AWIPASSLEFGAKRFLTDAEFAPLFFKLGFSSLFFFDAGILTPPMCRRARLKVNAAAWLIIKIWNVGCGPNGSLLRCFGVIRRLVTPSMRYGDGCQDESYGDSGVALANHCYLRPVPIEDIPLVVENHRLPRFAEKRGHRPFSSRVSPKL
ncbi:MAG: hypothetical protein WAU74_15825, partial [Pseudolabrys sp.]